MVVLCMIPTYCEAENIASIIEDIKALYPSYHILVIDDNSPDGTSQIVESLKKNDKTIHLIKRLGERGRGLSGKEGFIYAREMGADIAVEMDGDFSHDPIFIKDLVDCIMDGFDICIGSRLTKGGRDLRKSRVRKLLTRISNLYIRTVLNISVLDCTSGFRAFSKKALFSIPFEKLCAKGPEIVEEVLFFAKRANLSMKEVPIYFVEREAGESKLNLKKLVGVFIFVARLKAIKI